MFGQELTSQEERSRKPEQAELRALQLRVAHDNGLRCPVTHPDNNEASGLLVTIAGTGTGPRRCQGQPLVFTNPSTVWQLHKTS